MVAKPLCPLYKNIIKPLDRARYPELRYMLTGAERSKTLWELNDRLAQLNKKLSRLCLSIRYYTMADVWNNVTAGMLDRSNAEIASQALGRWRRCARVVTP